MSALLDYDGLAQRYGLSRRYVRDTLTGKPEKPRLQGGEDVNDAPNDCPGHALTIPAWRALQSWYRSTVSTIHSATVCASPCSINGRSAHGAARSAGGAGG